MGDEWISDERLAEIEALIANHKDWGPIELSQTEATALIARLRAAEERMESATLVAEHVLEWCEPIGQHNHMKWYRDAGKEIAEAIRADLDGKLEIVRQALDPGD